MKTYCNQGALSEIFKNAAYVKYTSKILLIFAQHCIEVIT